MRINKENYELYFVDYFDGNLSEELTRELFAFLDTHPGLKAEFEAFEPIALPPEKVIFPDKAGLKKSETVAVGAIDETNMEDYLVAYHEGDLSEAEIVELKTFLNENPSLQREDELFAQLKLHPDKEIVFKDKEALKKRAVLPFTRVSRWVAAASILLLAALYVINRPQERESLTPLSPLAQYEAPPIRSIQNTDEPVSRYSPAPALNEKYFPLRQREPQVSFTMAAFEPSEQLAESFAVKAPVKRMEATTLFYYDMLEEDLAYFEKLREYNSKNLFERIAYQANNRLFNQQEMYITDPGLSELRFNRESLTALNDFSFSDLIPERKEKPRNKDYHFKSDMIEFVRDKGE